MEPRTLLSISATAQLNLVSTTGTVSSPVYHYDIDVTNTGTTNIGTFWFGWVPGEDFLPTAPQSEASPSGWGSAITGGGLHDGSAIQWVATSNPIAAGHSLDGFTFTSTDSPTTLAGKSPFYPSTDILTSFVYIGAPENDPGDQFTVARAVTTAASTTTVVPSQATISDGSPVTFTATVAPASGTGATPTGTVTFFEDGNSLGSQPVQNDGTAALTTSSLPAGSLSITAQYSGDSSYSTSTSTAITETVQSGSSPTTTALMTSTPTIQGGSTVTLTATVAPVTAGATPTGTVNFSSNGSVVGSAPVQSNGTASLGTSVLAVGSDTLTATYTGDATYAASTSTSVTETVTAPPTLVPTIAKSTLAPSLVGGTAAHGVVTFDIANMTADTIKGKVTLQVYASTDGAIDGSAIQLTSVVRPINVKTTRPATESLPIKIAATLLPAGSYTLLARVVDLSGNDNDSTTGPALTVAAPFIALSETFTRSTIPSSAVAGTKSHGVAVVKITNSGNITTPGTTDVTLFASLSGVVDVTATVVNALKSKPLRIRSGKSLSLTIPVKEIPAVAAGDYTIIVQVTDADGNVTTATDGVLTITT